MVLLKEMMISLRMPDYCEDIRRKKYFSEDKKTALKKLPAVITNFERD
jgi:hypothetical protein